MLSSNRRRTQRGFRYGTAISVLVVFQLAPLLIPIVWVTDLSVPMKSGLSALLALGIPEIGVLLAIALIGKAEVRRLWSRLKRCLRRQWYEMTK